MLMVCRKQGQRRIHRQTRLIDPRDNWRSVVGAGIIINMSLWGPQCGRQCGVRAFLISITVWLMKFKFICICRNFDVIP